jgi:hypothetical protein
MLALNRSLLNREYTRYSNKFSEDLGFDHFYVQSQCNFLLENYIEIFYTIYNWNVSSIKCKTVLRRSMAAKKVDPLSLH